MKYFYLLIFIPFFNFADEPFSSNGDLSSMPESVDERTPALIRKQEERNSVIYRFQAFSLPDSELKESQIKHFQEIEGFVSLKEENGKVELRVSTNVKEQDLGRLLLFSARIYGYIGYKIVEE